MQMIVLLETKQKFMIKTPNIIAHLFSFVSLTNKQSFLQFFHKIKFKPIKQMIKTQTFSFLIYQNSIQQQHDSILLDQETKI